MEMPARRMHAGEVGTSVDLVRRLLAAQFPRWTGRPIAPVPSAGTDNALYRLGDDLVVRLPRIHWATGQIELERTWLPRLGPSLPLELPEVVAVGEPGEGYPWRWAVYRWLPGRNPAPTDGPAAVRLAEDLAGFIRALQALPTDGGLDAAANGLRGVPLITRDRATREALAALAGEIDVAWATVVWEAALAAPEWAGPPVWFHGDLLPGNLLVQQGRLSAVIDFSGLGVGDPAPDLMIAWGLFSGASRATFRAALGPDEATWRRGHGHALSQAAIFIPYYRHTNPGGVAMARRQLAEALEDVEN